MLRVAEHYSGSDTGRQRRDNERQQPESRQQEPCVALDRRQKITGRNDRSDHPVVETQRRESKKVVAAVLGRGEFDLARFRQGSEIHAAATEIFADRSQQAVVLAQAPKDRHLAVLLPLYRSRIR